MDIEKITKDIISSISEDITMISEGIDRIKFRGNTIYIILKDEDTKNRINDTYIYVIKKYLSSAIRGIEDLNMKFVSKDDLIDIAINTIENDGKEKSRENHMLEVRTPEHKIEEKEELDVGKQNIDVMDIWKVMLGRIQEIISSAAYNTLFKGSYQSGYDSGVVYVTVENIKIAQLIESRYENILKDISYELFGLRLSFQFQVNEKELIVKNDEKMFPVRIDDINDFLRYLKKMENR